MPSIRVAVDDLAVSPGASPHLFRSAQEKRAGFQEGEMGRRPADVRSNRIIKEGGVMMPARSLEGIIAPR